MSFAASASIIKAAFKLTSSRAPLISSSLVLSRNNRIQFQFRPQTTSALATSIKTGIHGLDENIKNNEDNWNRLSSWLKRSHQMLSKDDIDKLYKAFPKIVEDMMNFPLTADLGLTNARLKRNLEYCVPWFPIVAVQFLIANRFFVGKNKAKGKKLDNEEQHFQDANSIAWILQMLAETANMVDELVYEKELRYSLPCWRVLPGVGAHAINDSCVIFNGSVLLLLKYFKGRKYCSPLLMLIHQSLFNLECADNEISMIKLALPAIGNKDEQLNLKDQLENGKRHRFASIFPNLPIAAAMMLNGVYSEELVNHANKIGYDVGLYMTLVDDLAECYGDEKLIDSYTTSDIKEGRNSWVIWNAIEIANSLDRATLIECYGKKDDASILEVKRIYKELNIREVMKKKTKDLATSLEAKILELPEKDDLPCSIYSNIVKNYQGFTRGDVVV